MVKLYNSCDKRNYQKLLIPLFPTLNFNPINSVVSGVTSFTLKYFTFYYYLMKIPYLSRSNIWKVLPAVGMSLFLLGCRGRDAVLPTHPPDTKYHEQRQSNLSERVSIWEVYVTGVPEPGLGAYSLKLSYDPEKIDIKSFITAGPFGGAHNINQSEGWVRFNGLHPNLYGPKGDVKVATIVAVQRNGYSELTLDPSRVIADATSNRINDVVEVSVKPLENRYKKKE